MKCVITGHTSGTGQALYNYFQQLGWNVVGMSRSNGYDITKDQDKIVQDAQDCDLFINNASYGTSQLDLLTRLCTLVPKIVTMGDVGTNFIDIWPVKFAYDIAIVETEYDLIAMSDQVADMLLLKLSFVEDSHTIEKPNRISSDYTVSYNDIAKVIEFWVQNSKISKMEFRVKLSDQTVNNAKRVTGNIEKIDNLLLKVNHSLRGNLAAPTDPLLRFK